MYSSRKLTVGKMSHMFLVKYSGRVPRSSKVCWFQVEGVLKTKAKEICIYLSYSSISIRGRFYSGLCHQYRNVSSIWITVEGTEPFLLIFHYLPFSNYSLPWQTVMKRTKRIFTYPYVVFPESRRASMADTCVLESPLQFLSFSRISSSEFWM